MSDDDFDTSWIAAFAAEADLEPPGADEVARLLAIAARAAHDSGDRRNAPLSCFLVGLRLGRDGAVPDAAALDRYAG